MESHSPEVAASRRSSSQTDNGPGVGEWFGIEAHGPYSPAQEPD